jgi:hypothetical protein
MGTNYYLHPEPPCPTCKRPFEEVHIGKHSYGWPFCFDPRFPTFREWKAHILENDGKIQDEYGRNVPAKELLALIEESKRNPTHYSRDDARYFYTDGDGYRFSKNGGFS